MKIKVKYLLVALMIFSCHDDSKKNISSLNGIINENDDKSKIVEKLADSYLQGDFDIARDYFDPEGKHYFNNLVYDVDGIIEGYNFHSVLFNNIKHNNRDIYTSYFNNGKIVTYHDFLWTANSKLSGKSYSYPCHCRWEWKNEKISSTICYVDPTGIFYEVNLYQEKNN
tara:strand:+ start:9707 stop:10213 length:507 start_codon:yes stop_codon:yes gene_type:complete